MQRGYLVGAEAGLGQHLARTAFAPIAAVWRDQEGLGPDNIAPDTARKAEASKDVLKLK